eukprot:SAG25_NODE_1735_length_2426_cov_2.978943_4_plen_124_part_01
MAQCGGGVASASAAAAAAANDPVRDAGLVDLSAEWLGWGWVASAVPGRRPLRWARGGARYFVELDADVITPLQRTLEAKNAARDLRRRSAGFQLLRLRPAPTQGAKRQRCIKMIEALVARRVHK